MGTFTGRCQYCGNEINIIAENQEDADRQVSRDCGCGRMKQEEAIRERKALMTEELMKLIGPDCTSEGFRPLRDEVSDIVLQIARAVVEGEIQKATIGVDGTTITVKGGEKIKVARSMRYEQGSQI